FRWELDSAIKALENGKVESDVFSKGGFKWSVEFSAPGYVVKFSLRCAVEHKEQWYCDSEVEMSLLKANGKMHTYSEQKFRYSTSITGHGGIPHPYHRLRRVSFFHKNNILIFFLDT
ncbi:hypothetical protein PMAYCL1PPCAC_24978, partial [Pristionchus mayeri]